MHCLLRLWRTVPHRGEGLHMATHWIRVSINKQSSYKAAWRYTICITRQRLKWGEESCLGCPCPRWAPLLFMMQRLSAPPACTQLAWTAASHRVVPDQTKFSRPGLWQYSWLWLHFHSETLQVWIQASWAKLATPVFLERAGFYREYPCKAPSSTSWATTHYKLRQRISPWRFDSAICSHLC